MATLKGVWDEQSLGDEPEPTRIDVTATPDEWERIGPLPVNALPTDAAGRARYVAKQIVGTLADGTVFPKPADEGWTVEVAPDRAVVSDIARKVEVEVPDEALIDWLKRGG